MTYIKNLLHKIEDLSIGYHLPKFHILCQNSYGIETIIKLILPPLRVDPLLSVRAAAAAGGQKKSCFDLAENRAADSLWVGAHRYTRIKFASKLLWV